MRSVYYDATMLLHWGEETPVGIVRVEHYIVDHLLASGLAPKFVRFNVETGLYVEAAQEEATTIRGLVSKSKGLPPPAQTANEAPEPLPEPPLADVIPDWIDGGVPGLVRGARSTSRRDFAGALGVWLERNAPGPTRRRFAHRLGRHALRHGLILAGLAMNFGLRGGQLARLHLIQAVRRSTPAPPAPTAPPPPEAAAEAPPRDLLDALMDQRTVVRPQAIDWRQGDVLVCAGNGWDYLDYAQIGELGALGVRLIAVCYDVIVVEHPHVAAIPPDHLHRYFVEMAHAASAILTVSETSRQAFERAICAPNLIDCRVIAGRVPNLLFANAPAIGEVETAELVDQPFVVYCSTIEVRKNHFLLLKVWERLAERLAPDELPILVFVGKWGWRTDHVRAFVETEHRLRPKLRVYNRVSDAELIWLYRNARFALFPSFYEGLGNIEPLWFGTPMITSDHPSMTEATEGLMPALDPMDANAWVGQIEQLVREPERLEALRAIARRRFANLGPSTFGARLVEEIARPIEQAADVAS